MDSTAARWAFLQTGGDVRKTRPQDVRFWEKVDRDGPCVREDLGPCWTWTGHTSKKGYGLFCWSKPQVEYAHRASWRLVNGDWPTLSVCHKCDVRICVRPSHLFLGCNADNTADMVAKGRQRGAVGERNVFALLSEDDVVDIRSLAAFGATQGALRDGFGISQQCVSAILTRRTWRHVPGGW